LRTDLAFSGVSSRASVSHNSTEVGMTSTARVRRIRASSGSSSRLTVSFQSRTELGMNSRADHQLTIQRGGWSLPFLSTRFLDAVSLSSEAAFIQILTEVGTCWTAFPRMTFAFSGVCTLAPALTWRFFGLTFNSAAWNQTSSEFGHRSHPSAMIFLAWTIFLA
jgi:hypothetical protein